MAAGKDDHITLMNIHKIQNTTRVLRVPVSRRKLFYTCCLLLLCARAVGSVLMQQGNTNMKFSPIAFGKIFAFDLTLDGGSLPNHEVHLTFKSELYYECDYCWIFSHGLHMERSLFTVPCNLSPSFFTGHMIINLRI